MVELMRWPSDDDWVEVKRRAMVTIGKTQFKPPDFEWKKKILEARHSPIRFLKFSFYIECPSWVSVHLCRHVHAQPYVKSQRNDRQNEYDRNKAPQDTPVMMIWDMSAEELMVVANKRLCNCAQAETREVVQKMCNLVIEKCHEFDGVLVPMCFHNGGLCHEMYSCGRWMLYKKD